MDLAQQLYCPRSFGTVADAATATFSSFLYASIHVHEGKGAQLGL